jgi:hypothetical protein
VVVLLLSGKWANMYFFEYATTPNLVALFALERVFSEPYGDTEEAKSVRPSWMSGSAETQSLYQQRRRGSSTRDQMMSRASANQQISNSVQHVLQACGAS